LIICSAEEKKANGSAGFNKPVNKIAQKDGKARAAKLTRAGRSAIAKKSAQNR
jgi:hypothetical protein